MNERAMGHRSGRAIERDLDPSTPTNRPIDPDRDQSTPTPTSTSTNRRRPTTTTPNSNSTETATQLVDPPPALRACRPRKAGEAQQKQKAKGAFVSIIDTVSQHGRAEALSKKALAR
jgi:hypothetical protein